MRPRPEPETSVMLRTSAHHWITTFSDNVSTACTPTNVLRRTGNERSLLHNVGPVSLGLTMWNMTKNMQPGAVTRQGLKSGTYRRRDAPTCFVHMLYSHAPHNDVSVNDGPHTRQWSHKIIICYNTIVLQLPAVFSTVAGPAGRAV